MSAPKAVREYRSFIAQFGCMICGSPPQIHHPRGGSAAGEAGAGMKSGEAGAIPLCAHHHTGDEGIHRLGVSTWEQQFATQAKLRETLDTTIRVWERITGRTAPTPPADDAPAIPKVLPRRGFA